MRDLGLAAVQVYVQRLAPLTQHEAAALIRMSPNHFRFPRWIWGQQHNF